MSIDDDNGKALRATLCRVFIARVQAQGLKGKKRDAAAMEFVCGALAVLVEEHGEASKQAQYLTGLAFLVSVRGYSAIEGGQS